MKVNGAKLKKLRQQKLLTLRALSELSHVSLNTIWRLEHGFNAQPSTIGKLADTLEVEPSDFVDFDNQ